MEASNAAKVAATRSCAEATNAAPRATNTASNTDEPTPPTTAPAASHNAPVTPSHTSTTGPSQMLEPRLEKNVTIAFAPPIRIAPPDATNTPVLPLDVCE